MIRKIQFLDNKIKLNLLIRLLGWILLTNCLSDIHKAQAESIPSKTRSSFCLIDFQNISHPNELHSYLMGIQEGTLYPASYSAPSCKDIKLLGKSLQIVSISLNIAGGLMACTGAGIMGTMLTVGVGSIVQMVQFSIDYYPCQDPHTEEDINKNIKKIVCEELQSSGVKCKN